MEDAGEGPRARGGGTVILVCLARGETGRGGHQELVERRDLFCKGVEVMVVGKQEADLIPLILGVRKE